MVPSKLMDGGGMGDNKGRPSLNDNSEALRGKRENEKKLSRMCPRVNFKKSMSI